MMQAITPGLVYCACLSAVRLDEVSLTALLAETSFLVAGVVYNFNICLRRTIENANIT